MNNKVLILIVRFIGLVLLQVLILNKLNIFGFINPMIYVIWVVLFPINKNKTSLFLTSFLLGITIDTFSDSGGINAASILAVAYIRLPLLKMVLNKTDFDFILFNIRTIAFSKAFIYLSLIVIIHHFILFSLDYFSWSLFNSILYSTLITGSFTIFISLFGITLFSKKK